MILAHHEFQPDMHRDDDTPETHTEAENQRRYLTMPANAVGRCHVLQLEETTKREELAESIAQVVYGVFRTQDLLPGEAANVRYCATFALRRGKDEWTNAAQRKAITACVEALKTECGTVFATLPDKQLETVGRLLAGRVTAAFMGMLEGYTPLPPAEYLGIVRSHHFPTADTGE